MFESNGLVPRPPEPAIVAMAKRIPYISTTRRATIVLYSISALFFLLALFILISTLQNTSTNNFTLPDSNQTPQQMPISKP